MQKKKLKSRKKKKYQASYFVLVFLILTTAHKPFSHIVHAILLHWSSNAFSINVLSKERHQQKKYESLMIKPRTKLAFTFPHYIPVQQFEFGFARNMDDDASAQADELYFSDFSCDDEKEFEIWQLKMKRQLDAGRDGGHAREIKHLRSLGKQFKLPRHHVHKSMLVKDKKVYAFSKLATTQLKRKANDGISNYCVAPGRLSVPPQVMHDIINETLKESVDDTVELTSCARLMLQINAEQFLIDHLHQYEAKKYDFLGCRTKYSPPGDQTARHYGDPGAPYCACSIHCTFHCLVGAQAVAVVDAIQTTSFGGVNELVALVLAYTEQADATQSFMVHRQQLRSIDHELQKCKERTKKRKRIAKTDKKKSSSFNNSLGVHCDAGNVTTQGTAVEKQYYMHVVDTADGTEPSIPKKQRTRYS